MEAIECPKFDEEKFKLGKLCPHGHEWGTTGQSLRRIINYGCEDCHKIRCKANSLKRQGKSEEAEALRESIVQEYDDFEIPGEIWLDVVGYEGLYQVSDWGRIRSAYVNRTLTPTPVDQYSHVTLRKNNQRKTLKVHRLVAEAFLGLSQNVDQWQVNHLNGIRNDNRLCNLEWCSPQENVQHSFGNLNRKKLVPLKGENHHSAKLSNATIEYIRNMKGVIRNIDLAKEFQVSPSLITKIQKGTYRNSTSD